MNHGWSLGTVSERKTAEMAGMAIDCGMAEAKRTLVRLLETAARSATYLGMYYDGREFGGVLSNAAKMVADNAAAEDPIGALDSGSDRVKRVRTVRTIEYEGPAPWVDLCVSVMIRGAFIISRDKRIFATVETIEEIPAADGE